MVTNFAPCELPPLLIDNQRYLFNTFAAAVTFCTGMRAMSFMDAGQTMVVRLSMDGRWAVDFELTPAQRFISDYVNKHTDESVRDRYDHTVTKRVYQNQDRLVREYIKPICNRRFLPNASQSVLECLTASCAGLWERAAEVYALPPVKREGLIESIVRTATFKVLRWIPEKQGDATDDSEFSEPVESVDGYAEPASGREKDFYEIEDFLIAHIDREHQQKQPVPEPPTEYDHMALRLGKADADWLWSMEIDGRLYSQRDPNRKRRTPADQKRLERLRMKLRTL
jgi:hypothetical protein